MRSHGFIIELHTLVGEKERGSERERERERDGGGEKGGMRCVCEHVRDSGTIYLRQERYFLSDRKCTTAYIISLRQLSFKLDNIYY